MTEKQKPNTEKQKPNNEKQKPNTDPITRNVRNSVPKNKKSV